MRKAASTQLLAGAEACRAMLSSLNALQRVKIKPDPTVSGGHDDGTRYDYAGADRAIATALDNHGDNAGFRRSLAHYLLSIMLDGLVPDVPKLRAENMLADDGYRPQGDTVDDATPSSAGTAGERQQLAASASYEIESIVLTLQKLEDTTDNVFLMRGLFLRIEALNSVVMSVTNGSDEGRELNEMREVLFGPRWRQQKEMDHV